MKNIMYLPPVLPCLYFAWCKREQGCWLMVLHMQPNTNNHLVIYTIEQCQKKNVAGTCCIYGYMMSEGLRDEVGYRKALASKKAGNSISLMVFI